MATNFYGGRTPLFNATGAGAGIRAEDSRQGGTGMVRGMYNGKPQRQRNFSALNQSSPFSNLPIQAMTQNNAYRIPQGVNKPNVNPIVNPNAIFSPSTAKQQTNNTPPNFKNNLLNYLDSAGGKGLTQGLLEASGYHDRPISFGQALAMGMAKSNEYESTERANELAKLQMEIERSKIKPQETFTQQMIEVDDGKGGFKKVPVNVSDLSNKVTPVMSGGGNNFNLGQGSGGWKTVNEKFGTEVNDWVISGGFSGAKANLIKIDDAIEQLEKSKDDFFGLTGKNVGFIHKGLRAMFNPDSADLEDNIRSIVYESLRQTLGAQFAEKEGEKLIQASFNSMLSEEKNIVRLKRMRAKILEMAKAKQKSYEYFIANNGNMSGYSGSTFVFDNENQMTVGAEDVLNSIYTVEAYKDFSDKEFTNYFEKATDDEQAWILKNAENIPQIKIGEEE